MASVNFCGQADACVLGAHGVNLLAAARDLVELKMANEADSIDRMINEQLKLTPRRANLAMRTRVLIFCTGGSNINYRLPGRPCVGATYHVLGLLLVVLGFDLFQNFLLPKSRTQGIGKLLDGCSR